jgi:exodeoxyribonuclease VII large subunit
MVKQSKLDIGIPGANTDRDPDSANGIGGSDPGPREGQIYTVSGITRHIKDILEHHPDLNDIWVRGEISNLTRHKSGHIYFSIKDEAALIRCAIFRGTAGRIRFDLDHGLKIVAHGSISVYLTQGNYQFVIDEVRPDGLGALHQAYLKLKEKLEKEGLFDEIHKKDLPRFPRVIGVATSDSGAAVRDIINVIRRRFPKVTIYLMPTIVQGDAAAKSIVNSIEKLDRLKEMDVIIIGRGGGSLEDLWAFNEEPVVRAVFAAEHPIISAVGHQRDYTLSDFAADVRAPTPSAAAEIVVPDMQELAAEIEGMQSLLKQNILNLLTQYKLEYSRLRESFAFQRPYDRIRELQQQIDELTGRMGSAVKNIMTIKKLEAEGLTGKLDSLDPTAVLSRGYSITTTGDRGGRIVSSISGLKPGSKINILVHDGEIVSRIEDTETVFEPITHLLSRVKKKRVKR